MKYLAFDRPLLRSASEGVMPFYILHQTVLLCIGYFVMTWAINDAAKWVIVFISSFIVITTLYMLFIRKFEVLRFLFGMKTTRPFFDVFRKRSVLIVLPVLYVGLIVFAASNITAKSSTGVRVVNDEEASIGKAIEFSSGANPQAESEPKVYVEMRFSAPRGKTDINSGYTDSVWAQADDQIGTRTKSVRLGNWFDVHPVGVYGWASDTDQPIAIVLKYSGDHTIRIQPRQIPHRIDQIWLSRFQHRIPNTLIPIR
jgi:hypothetical protein